MIIVFVLVYIVIILTVAIIIINSTTSSKALAYLLLIILFPIVGVIIYFAIGKNYRIHKLYSKKLKIDRNTFPHLEESLLKFNQQIFKEREEEFGNFINLARFKPTESILTGNNDVELLINGEVKFHKVLESIQQAKKFIHIEYYIFKDDTIGNRIGDLLKQKAKEGVQVRLIYDDFGSKGIRKSFVNELKKHGVEAFPFYKIKLLAFANRINYRNHRKIIVIDGIIGYVGGINISDKYINPNPDNLYWRDTHLKITGAAVLALQRIFIADWNFCAKQSIGVDLTYFPLPVGDPIPDQQMVQIVFSGPDSDHPSIMYAMIQAILSSKKEILITTPYFVPNNSFINAIKIARMSNVSIQLLVPGVSDSFVVNATCNSYYKELLELGVDIYKYKKGFVHAKTMVCDNFLSTVGTANLDQRSFDLNFEVNAFIYDADFSNKLSTQFYQDIKDAEQLHLKHWENRSYPIQFLERVVRLFSPLM